MAILEQIAEVNALVGEGPIWDMERQRLLWTDIQKGRMFRYDPSTQIHETIHEGYNVGGFAINRQGGLLQCIWDGVVLWNSDDDWKRLYDETYDGNLLRFNDISADPEGRVFAGTYLSDGLGKLFRFDPKGGATIVEEGIGCSNGIGFSPDHNTMYYTDSTKRIIYAYDYNRTTGDIRNRRDFIVLGNSEGVPDGMTVDAEGYIWTAVWFGGCVIRFDPDGNEERRVHLPAHQTSSVMFGGKDLTDIYITTADFKIEPGGILDPVGYDWDAYKNGYRGGSLFRIRQDEIQGGEEFQADFAWPV